MFKGETARFDTEYLRERRFSDVDGLGRDEQDAAFARDSRYSVCLLYWYKSTHTDAGAAAAGGRESEKSGPSPYSLLLSTSAVK